MLKRTLLLAVLSLAIVPVGCDRSPSGPVIPACTGLVVDEAKALSAGDAARVDKAIRDFEAVTGGQFRVLIVRTLQGEPVERFGIRVFEKWKVGHAGRDDGVVLVVATDDQKSRLEVGRGLEGRVNDARAGDLLREAGPLLRKRQWGDGVCRVIEGVGVRVGKGGGG